MLKDIVEATPLEGYQVRLQFEDGVVGELDLSAINLFEGVFAPLKGSNRFRELRHILTWAPSIGRTEPISIPLSSMHV
jgi:hypothetical protein